MTEVPSGEFKPTRVASIIFGSGSVRRLREKVEELGARRALLLTVPPIVTGTDFVPLIKDILGDRCAGVFSGVVQHVPRQCVIEGAKVARELKADLLISLGGSSVADTAKGINLALAEARTPEEFFARFDRSEFTLPGSLRATEFHQPKLPFIAIPTTLSGGEFTAGAGITDTVRQHKDVSYDDRVTARVVILDPQMTVHTGRELWASTALKSLSDCVEVACSPRHQPFADALALHAIRLISCHLMPSIAEPMDMGARALLQHAAGMSLQGLGAVGGGIVAALRHQIGGIYNVGHGVASSIVMPFGISFNRPEIDDRLALVAHALGLSDNAAAVIGRIRQLLKETGLPTRLRDVGVPREGIQVIAEASSSDHQIRNNPKPVSREQLIAILEQAW